jgi:hypothetical protein
MTARTTRTPPGFESFSRRFTDNLLLALGSSVRMAFMAFQEWRLGRRELSAARRVRAKPSDSAISVRGDAYMAFQEWRLGREELSAARRVRAKPSDGAICVRCHAYRLGYEALPITH